MQGYIKLYRSLLEWEWYKNTNVKNLFFHCLLRANHADKKWQGILIKKGSFVTSYENLSIETGLSVRQVRTAIDKLKLTNEITYKPTSQYSIITINNWDKFQLNDTQNDNQMTSERQTNDNQMTTNKNEKNEKNEKKLFIVPKVEEIKNYCSERNNNINPLHFFDYYQSKGWMIGKNKMKDWKAAIRTWEQKSKKNETQIDALEEAKKILGIKKG